MLLNVFAADGADICTVDLSVGDWIDLTDNARLAQSPARDRGGLRRRGSCRPSTGRRVSRGRRTRA
jgi:hypothetical protein